MQEAWSHKLIPSIGIRKLLDDSSGFSWQFLYLKIVCLLNESDWTMRCNGLCWTYRTSLDVTLTMTLFTIVGGFLVFNWFGKLKLSSWSHPIAGIFKAADWSASKKTRTQKSVPPRVKVKWFEGSSKIADYSVTVRIFQRAPTMDASAWRQSRHFRLFNLWHGCAWQGMKRSFVSCECPLIQIAQKL